MASKTYGSISGNEQLELTIDLSDPFGEKETFANKDFWKNCRKAFNDGNGKFSYKKCQTKIRAKYLIEKFSNKKEATDLIFHLLTVVHDEYSGSALRDTELHYPTFVYELSELVLAILEIDNAGPEDYKHMIFPSTRSSFKCSILHLAAERSLVQIIKYAVEFYPKLGNKPLNVDGDNFYPVNFLLEMKDNVLSESTMKATDEAASFLLSKMQRDRVRILFESSDRELASFRFPDFIVHGGFNKTCITILDQLMDSSCPFIKDYANNTEENQESQEEVDDDFIPNMPVRYHFYYQILDGDDSGQSPYTDDKLPNENFNYSAKSCLQLLAENSSKEIAIKHPVVRSLVRHKWDTYAKYLTIAHACLYLFFVILLSVALFTQPNGRVSTSYEGSKDVLRAVCEIGALLLTLMYLASEIYQMFVEGVLKYIKDLFNWFDVFGMLSIILVVPLRYTKHRQAELILSGLGFAINFIRICKFFPASRALGVYSKTVARIIYYDVSKFSVLVTMVMFSFTGMLYLFMTATGSLTTVGDFWKIFLRETKSFAEASPFAEDYLQYQTWLIIFLMINMAAILVVFLNILIGQISYRYEEALDNASIYYDIDRCTLVAKAERTPFKSFLNFRVKHFIKADFVSSEEVAEELIGDWFDTLEFEKVEKRKKALKMFIGQKSIKKRSMKKNPESISLVAPD